LLGTILTLKASSKWELSKSQLQSLYLCEILWAKSKD
jgi:hypothetical protein